MSGNRRRRARNLLDNAEEQVRRFAGVLSNVLNRERQVAVDNLDSDREYLASESEDSDSIGSSSENSEYSGGSTNRIGDAYTEHRSRRIRSQNIRGGISGLRVRNPHPPSPASEHSDWSIPDENSSRSEDNEIEVITVNPMQRWNRVIVDESFDMPESQVAGDHDPSHSDQPVSPLQTTANNNHSAEPNQPVLSDSDSSQLNIRRRPKRRRTDELATQDEEQACSSKPDLIKVFDSLNNDTGASIDDDADDGCTICYEDFANAGVHRLVSLKCGHFFGQSCIERWIRGEGRTAGCPTCKTKASNKDIRKHYARSIKLTDTSELEALRELNATLHVKVSQLEMESARKDREISDLNRRLKEGVNRVPVVSLPLPCSRPGRMSLTPGKKMALSVSNNGSSRAFDWNGECFAVGVTSPSGNMFQPYAIRKIGWVSSEFRAGPYLPLHSNRIRVVCFSPFESNLILSGGEDKKAVVHILGGSMRRQWKMPNDRQVWAGCWTAPNKVALGLNDGRVLEFDIESESTEPVRDYTQGIGNMPILFIGFDSISSVLIVASFKKVLAFRNDKVYPLLNNIDDQFDKIRSIAFDEGTLSFVATFSPGANSPGISHRLYKIEIDQDSDEVCCVKLGMWITACVQSSTMWNNCLFSYQNGLFSIIYNEDKKRLDVHDWSGKRTDVMMSFSSSSSSCNLASMRTIGGTKDSKSTAQSKRLRFRLGDHSYVVDVDATARPVSLLRRNESVKEKQFDTTAAIETIEKLRYILHQLNSGQLPLEDLKRNIEYAALVLETAYMDETRRICDEDDDLAEVTPETVPDEVREWLAATFTRQNAGKKREKPKFKSVANAIRTGIFFDKLFRKQQSVQCPIPLEISEVLREINSWSFNPFHLNEVSEGHALKYVGFELFNRYGFMDRFKIPLHALENYLHALEQGYSKHNNPYHNVVHAADVTQSSHFMLSQTGLASSLGDLELLAVLFGALIHDYEHTGHTNNFHIQSGSNFALLYNDRSVLENHHVSSCFRLMKEDDKNIFLHLTRDEYRELRNMVIEIVLATDMSTHFVQIKTMKNMLSLPEGIDKNKALCLIVHACDISHPSKPWLLHERWTEGVLEEFFRQGDLEASMGLPYSPLCDRHTVHVADSQIGFIDFIVEPTMVVCGELLTKMVEPLVSLPPSDTLFPPNGDHNESTSPSAALSPLPDMRNSSVSPSSIRRLPLNYCGKLDIPTPWMKYLHDNKVNWKERASKEEEERKKAEASKVSGNGDTQENGRG